eukprot:743543-Amorphochlora_amoeboformis.AAC.2
MKPASISNEMCQVIAQSKLKIWQPGTWKTLECNPTAGWGRLLNHSSGLIGSGGGADMDRLTKRLNVTHRDRTEISLRLSALNSAKWREAVNRHEDSPQSQAPAFLRGERPWIKKLPTPKKGRKYSSAGRSSRKKTSQNSQNFVSSLDEKECNLYRSVANLKSALKQIVKKFAKKVEEAEEKSLTEITNFFTQTAGSKKYIKVDQIMDGDKDELEEDVTQSYDLSMKQYPLAPDAKGAQAKAINKLSKRLRDFWGKLIQEMSDSEKFDVFMDHCFEWLKCLCKYGLRKKLLSKQLALRHACSSNAYWIVEGLIAIASPLQDEIEGKEKQLNSTKAKGTKNKLSKDIQDLEGRVQALNEFMKKGFE